MWIIYPFIFCPFRGHGLPKTNLASGLGEVHPVCQPVEVLIYYSLLQYSAVFLDYTVFKSISLNRNPLTCGCFPVFTVFSLGVIAAGVLLLLLLVGTVVGITLVCYRHRKKALRRQKGLPLQKIQCLQGQTVLLNPRLLDVQYSNVQKL